MPAGQEWILPLEKWVHFFLGPWLLVCQFIDISNQMESTGEVSNVEQKNLYNGLLYKKILLMFDTSPVVSIWLKMSINWHTKSQGPKKKCTHFSRGRIHSCPAGTARNQGSFTSMALWSVQSFLSSTVHTYVDRVTNYFQYFCSVPKVLALHSAVSVDLLQKQTFPICLIKNLTLVCW